MVENRLVDAWKRVYHMHMGGNLLVTAISAVLALLIWLLSVIVSAKLTNLPGAVIMLLPGLGCGLLLFIGSAVTKVRQWLAVRHRKSIS